MGSQVHRRLRRSNLRLRRPEQPGLIIQELLSLGHIRLKKFEHNIFQSPYISTD